MCKKKKNSSEKLLSLLKIKTLLYIEATYTVHVRELIKIKNSLKNLSLDQLQQECKEKDIKISCKDTEEDLRKHLEDRFKEDIGKKHEKKLLTDIGDIHKPLLELDQGSEKHRKFVKYQSILKEIGALLCNPELTTEECTEKVFNLLKSKKIISSDYNEYNILQVLEAIESLHNNIMKIIGEAEIQLNTQTYDWINNDQTDGVIQTGDWINNDQKGD